ncbi:MAG TPA: copper amine oxidase N-terminal domain-containing protein [Clostridia bacterium]|nr:copper amine oxidase N-terminal domain-containing protein [Clostridia bacterium]
MRKYKAFALWLIIIVISAGSLTGCASKDRQELLNALSSRSSAVRLDFSNASAGEILPVRLGDKTFVPLEPVSKIMGLKLEIQKNGEFVLNTKKEKITGKAGSTTILVNDAKHYLTFPVMKIENQIFVPDQFVMRYLSTGVYYDEKTKELLIQRIE